MSRALTLADVGKRYVKYEDVPLLLTRLRFRAGKSRTHLWAIRHVDLEAEEGESVGVIGRNGSGKSTMLRMLAGVTAPTEGAASVRGRVAPLISVGVGFHAELTGRENVYVNGTILGLSRKEIDRRFDQIVDFAELESFIDTPVKFYSSGMFVRLGFSVAVASRPDVLLVDEVLAVGDINFQAKCFERMEQIKIDGTTVVLVSHNINAIRRMCSRVLVLHDGVPKFMGPTNDAIGVYHELMGVADTGEAGEEADHRRFDFRTFQLLDAAGDPTNHVGFGDPLTFRVEGSFVEAIDDPVFLLRIETDSGQLAYAENTYRRPSGRFDAGGLFRCEARFTCRLVTGSYRAQAWVGPISKEWNARTRPLDFFVTGRPLVKGIADLEASIEITRDGSAAQRPEPERGGEPPAARPDLGALSGAFPAEALPPEEVPHR